jgi:hypothetical protein
MKKLYLIFLILCFVVSCDSKDIHKKYPIVSVFNDKEIQGSFILGCGTIKNVEWYYFFVQLTDGGLIRRAHPAKFIIVYEGHNEPYITYTQKNCLGSRDWINENGHWSDIYDFKIYVPAGTIVRKYVLK